MGTGRDLAVNYNNIFGVKYTSGAPVYLPTQEYIDGQMVSVVEPFQSYSSLYEACVAQARLLRGSRLYAGAWRENAASYQDATAWLQGRYATDPNYASKLNYLIAHLGLTAYDNGGVPSSALTSSASTTSTSTSTTSSSQTSAAGGTYTVQKGDTLSAIALRHGTSVSNLMSINGLADANSIRVGQSLKLSASGTSSTSVSSTQTASQSSSASTYTVQAGDSLSSIAAKYSTTTQRLQTLNSLSDANRLHIGQRLQISAGTANTSSASTSVATTTSTATSTGSSTRYAHTVLSGESLYSIAQANGISAQRLAEINGITINTSIHPGQTLNV